MRARVAAVLVFLAWQVAATHRYVAAWHSDLTLWAHAVTAAPGKARAHLNYAKALYVFTDDVAAMRREADLGQRLAESQP